MHVVDGVRDLLQDKIVLVLVDLPGGDIPAEIVAPPLQGQHHISLAPNRIDTLFLTTH